MPPVPSTVMTTKAVTCRSLITRPRRLIVPAERHRAEVGPWPHLRPKEGRQPPTVASAVLDDVFVCDCVTVSEAELVDEALPVVMLFD